MLSRLKGVYFNQTGNTKEAQQMNRYTATDAMYDSLSTDERAAVQMVLDKMQALYPQQRIAFMEKILTTPVVKIGTVTLCENTVTYLVGQIERTLQ
jgi:hypothetical protein